MRAFVRSDSIIEPLVSACCEQFKSVRAKSAGVVHWRDPVRTVDGDFMGTIKQLGSDTATFNSERRRLL